MCGFLYIAITKVLDVFTFDELFAVCSPVWYMKASFFLSVGTFLDILTIHYL